MNYERQVARLVLGEARVMAECAERDRIAARGTSEARRLAMQTDHTREMVGLALGVVQALDADTVDWPAIERARDEYRALCHLLADRSTPAEARARCTAKRALRLATKYGAAS